MKKVVLYIMLAATCFATMEVALKIAGNNLDALQLTSLRFLIGGLVLLLPALAEMRRNAIHFTGRDYLWMLLLGTIGVAVSMLCFQLGVQRCNAATAAPLFCTNPLYTMVIAHLFTSEKMTRRKWLAFAICFMAVLFMIRPWDVQPGNTVPGMVLLIFSAVAFSAYTVMGKRTIRRFGAVPQTSISFLFGSLVLLTVTVITGHPVFAGVAENWQIVVYTGLVVTGLGYLMYFLALKASDATTVSITFFIKPVLAPIFAILILHETVYWNTVVGIFLLITASVITLLDTLRNRAQ